MLIKEQFLNWKLIALLRIGSTVSSPSGRACPDFSGRKGGGTEMEDKVRKLNSELNIQV